MEPMQGVVETASAPEARDLLSSLPDELLLQVWIQLMNPRSLSLTSKRFHALSKNTLWRGKWFVRRFERYLIVFEAIARPKIFTAALFDQLVRLNAPVSRNLVQLLHAMREPVLRQQLLVEEQAEHGGAPIWAKNVSYTSYAAVISHAAKLYGDDLSYELAETDSYIFRKWLESEQDEVDVLELWNRVRRLVTSTNFVALPFTVKESRSGLGLVVRRTYGLHHEMISTIVKISTLAAAIDANGFEVSDYVVYSVLEGLPCPTSRLVGPIDRSLIPGQILVENLKFDGKVLYPDWYISFALWPLQSVPIGLEYLGDQLVETLQAPQERQIYNMLYFLDQQAALPFKLEEEIARTLEPLDTGSVSAPMITMLERLEQDFSKHALISRLFVRAMFVKAERESLENVDEIKKMMRGYAATEADIRQACLRNGCRTVTPIRFAIAHVDGFDLSAFMAELLDSLLMQPYRGIMLLEIARFFAQMDSEQSFSARLQGAVSKQAFDCSQLPAQQWELRTQPWFHFKCNAVSPVRSLLGHNFFGENAESLKPCKCKERKFILEDLEGLTDVNPPRAFKICDHTENSEIGGTRAPAIDDATCFGNHWPVPPTEIDDTFCDIGAFCNIYGPIMEDDQPVGEVIVDLLGPESYAAYVVMSHALVNGNTSLVDSLLGLGVALTVEHFKIALKIGYSLPESMLRYVQSGAPFLSSFGKADVPTARRPGRGLTDDQWVKCHTLATKELSKLLIEIDIQEDGSLVFRKLSARRRRPARSLTAAPSPAPTLASQVEPDVELDGPLRRLNNAKQWLSQLTLLRHLEEEKSTLLARVSGQEQLHSHASKSLREFIHVLQVSIKAIGAEDASQAVDKSLRPLWKELSQATGDASLLADLKKRVDQSQRGLTSTRSSKPAAFKRSPYSFRSDKFREKFTCGDSPARQEPQLEPLSDEDSQDEDFGLNNSESEEADSDSASVSSMDDQSDEEGDEDDEEEEEEVEGPPLKRLRSNNGSAAVAPRSDKKVDDANAPASSSVSLQAEEEDEDYASGYDSAVSESLNFTYCLRRPQVL